MTTFTDKLFQAPTGLRTGTLWLTRRPTCNLIYQKPVPWENLKSTFNPDNNRLDNHITRNRTSKIRKMTIGRYLFFLMVTNLPLT